MSLIALKNYLPLNLKYRENRIRPTRTTPTNILKYLLKNKSINSIIFIKIIKINLKFPLKYI